MTSTECIPVQYSNAVLRSAQTQVDPGTLFYSAAEFDVKATVSKCILVPASVKEVLQWKAIKFGMYLLQLKPHSQDIVLHILSPSVDIIVQHSVKLKSILGTVPAVHCTSRHLHCKISSVVPSVTFPVPPSIQCLQLLV